MNNFSKRLVFGLIYVLLVVFSTTYNAYTFFGLFFIFMLFSIFEFQKMIQSKNYIPYIIGTLFFCIAFINSQTNFENIESFPRKVLIELLLSLIAVLSIFYLFIKALYSKKTDNTNNLGKIALTLLYPILPFILLIKIPFYNETYDNKIILGVFILIWTNDTFAYLIGKNFGKHKLFERISPKKTIEGFVGGAVFTLITSYILSVYFTNTSFNHWLIIALIISVFGTIGDLIESMFKREANIKDSSNLIPGHGGFLDRLDSIIFAAPFIYVFLYLTKYLSLINVS